MNLQSGKSRERFAWFARGVLAYNLPVILWGAYVRVSFSGDGCGAHWPTCDGQFLPAHMAKPKLIEFTHRMMTGVDSVAILALCVLAFLIFSKGHAVRRYAVFSLVFLFIEALLGAGLVLFRLVAKDQSAGRVIYLSAHLTNTMLLLGALTITAWLAYSHTERVRFSESSRRLFGAVLATVVVSITGTIAALGDTLFPASSLSAGMQQDFSSASSVLLRLRLIHPVFAVVLTVYLLWTAVQTMRGNPEGTPARTAGARVVALALLQVTLGALNLSLLAPLWMQLIHLLMADLVWVSVVLLVCESVRVRKSEKLGVLV